MTVSNASRSTSRSSAMERPPSSSFIASGFAAFRRARAYRRCGRWRRGYVVPIDDRVEHQVELAVVLPAVNRVVREEQYPALPIEGIGDIDREGLALEIVRADHQSAQHRGVTTPVLREHVALVGDTHPEDLRPLPEFHRERGALVAIEDRMIGTQVFR